MSTHTVTQSWTERLNEIFIYEGNKYTLQAYFFTSSPQNKEIKKGRKEEELPLPWWKTYLPGGAQTADRQSESTAHTEGNRPEPAIRSAAKTGQGALPERDSSTYIYNFLFSGKHLTVQCSQSGHRLSSDTSELKI